ncbi:hypothetical protein [Pseudomonas sp. A34-9]|uniref:hypothetical protein n=1 Tax=Pseudomonas sp. A34-9 TaxID=3034675 RepID=UPI00240E8866|nr:hypothetical protein [Pseudomonas sp. A34-9]
MDIQSSVLNELFVLYPVIIQGWVTPVKPDGIAHGGIPKVLYDGQPQGLECLIDPWTELQLKSWTMAADDRVDLYVNDDPSPATGTTVKPGEENLRVRLYLPHGHLRQGPNPLKYIVTRVGGNTETSRELVVLYHLRAPDSLDLVIPPDVIKDGVSAARAAQGVIFTFLYNNRRQYDRIQCLVGDTQFWFDVPDGTAPITYTLYTDTFRAAGDNPSAVVEFFVVDQLGNRSQSPEKRLDIHLDRVDLTTPVLDNVLDAANKEVLEGTSTFSTTLKLKGKASNGQQVEIFDGSGASAVPKGTVTAHPTTGEWERTITVPVGVRRLYAKALYAVSPVYSNVRNLTVTAATTPTLVNVLDASNEEVLEGTFTISTTLKLRGKASNGQQVEIFDGSGASAVPKGTVTAHPTTGDWEHEITVPVGARRLYAKALYAVSPVYSNVRNLTVTAATTPTLVNVLDASNKEVLEGTFTISTTLKLRGKASNGQQVEIFDGSGASAVPKGKATAHPATGDWEHAITVPVGARRLYAKALYAVNPVDSNVRNLTVTSPSDFVITPSTLTINGFNLFIEDSGLNWTKTGADAPNTFQQVTVTGGVPPYFYSIPPNQFASVDSTGLVRSIGNGTSTLTVRDSAGNAKTVSVNTSSVYKILVNNTPQSRAQAEAWMRSVGGTPIYDQPDDEQYKHENYVSFQIVSKFNRPPGERQDYHNVRLRKNNAETYITINARPNYRWCWTSNSPPTLVAPAMCKKPI